jgi:uncharacterized iron-regulated membrane protein
LVWHDHLDALINPARYAISGQEATQPVSAYLASASAALPDGVTALALRFPEEPGWPVTVMGRGATSEGGGPPPFKRVYLDPPTARALDVLDQRNSLVGFLHRFHENLTIPQYSGRAIVGWIGVGMLLLTLTGLWLWWPRNGAFLIGLRWRRAPSTMTNLHFLLGFWIALPLAVVSFTGVYLSFPQPARQAMAAIAPMNPQAGRPGFGGEVVRDTVQTVDHALALALAAEPGATPVAIFLPTRPAARPGERREGAAPAQAASQAGRGERGPAVVWRVQLRTAADDLITVMVDDRSGVARRAPDPLAGDRAAQWMRWLHEGSHAGALWQGLVFLTGVFPAVLGVTGLIMWLRARRNRKMRSRLRALNSPQSRRYNVA